jgi:CheY-like chemotaxis protein
MSLEKYRILIADDSEDDRFLLTRVLRKVPCFETIVCVEDGQMAIDYLTGTPPYDNRVCYPMPDVLLLDLKMPRVDGFDVLRWLTDQDFHGLQVIVLSSSFLPEDIAKTLTMGADLYLIKGDPVETVESIESFLRASGSTVRSSPTAAQD